MPIITWYRGDPTCNVDSKNKPAMDTASPPTLKGIVPNLSERRPLRGPKTIIDIALGTMMRPT